MLKIRITYTDNEEGNKELQQYLETLEKDNEILDKSRKYPGRNGSKFSNIYISIEPK